MYNLLIVDDEHMVVEGIKAMLQDAEHLELNIFRAYTALEALERMKSARVDVVLSDIQMPGMNGLELLKHIRSQWPRCKVIFLTGYDYFEYAQTAIRNGADDYLLKTEREENIIHTIEKALKKLEEELTVIDCVLQAKQYLNNAYPLLQKEFFQDLLQGDSFSSKVLERKFSELRVPLDSSEKALLLLIRIDSYGSEWAPSDKTLVLYAIKNIAEEYLSSASEAFALSCEHLRLLVMLQPKHGAQDRNDINHSQCWSDMMLFAEGMLELIQTTCSKMLNITISIASSSSVCDWSAAGEKYALLKSLLDRGLGMEREVILNEKNISESVQQRGSDLVYKLQQYIKKHLAEDLSLVKLSEVVSYNSFYLSHLYKQITGEKLSEYIARLRINEAKELLKQSNIKIHEVSQRVGFDTPSYFTRFFKKMTGVIPQEYRDSINI